MKGEDKKRKEELKELIPLVRFPIMDLEDLLESVEPTGLISLDEMMNLVCYISATAG